MRRRRSGARGPGMAYVVAVVLGILSAAGTSAGGDWEDAAGPFARCELAVREVEREDRVAVVDDSPTRLYHTWLSQECEARAGPEYVIRKYTFYRNGTFLLLRHHYAEDSCSIATHTVLARGSVNLTGRSAVVSGAIDAKFHVDAVNVVPLNRQVAHKFGHRLNSTCGPQPRWRPYVSQLIYEQPRQRSPSWHGPLYNSLQAHSPAGRRLGADCLEAFGIEFGELRLLRVQKRPCGSTTYCRAPRYELLLGSVAPNAHSRWTHRSTSLQPTAMIRADTTSDCPICNSVSRGTEFSPPLLHEVAALPALIGGYWISERCESSEGGVWSRRRFQMHSGDKLWTGRWDYYEDPRCSTFLYSLTAAGSYVQRAGRQRRHEEELDDAEIAARFLLERSAADRSGPSRAAGPWMNGLAFDGGEEPVVEMSPVWKLIGNEGEETTGRSNGNVHPPRDVHRSAASVRSRFAAMLRDGHRPHEAAAAAAVTSWRGAPSGTTELDLHVAESVLTIGDVALAARCGAPDRAAGLPLLVWPRNCVPGAVEAPATLALRAKLGVNWNGQYTLLLGKRDDSVWDAVLRQCAQIPSRNSSLRAHLRRSVGLRFGLLPSATTSRSADRCPSYVSRLILLLLCCLRILAR